MSSTRLNTCVGILYCGDMGSALAQLLREQGFRVTTTCEGRGRRTRERAQRAGIEILPTLDDVIRVADIVVSLVLPDVALNTARQYAARCQLAPPGTLFVDANSVDVDELREIEGAFQGTKIELVDATIHGGAGRLRDLAVLYLGGTAASELTARLDKFMRTEIVGPRLGDAKRMKLLLAALSKSLNVLFLEVALLAQKAGSLDLLLSQTKFFYPGIMTAIERMLPTYPEHAARRVVELESIQHLAHELDAPHGMIDAARQLLASVSWPQPLQQDTVQQVIQSAYLRHESAQPSKLGDLP